MFQTQHQHREWKGQLSTAYQNTERWNNAIKFVDLLAAPVHIITDAADTYQKYKSVISGLVIFGGLGLGLYLFTRR